MSNYYYEELDDNELVKIISQSNSHDHRAFEALVYRHEPMAFRICLRILGQESDANDVLQEVFLRMYRHLDKFEGKSSFKTWLMTIVRNECFSFISRNRKDREIGFEESEELETHDDQQLAPVENQAIARDLIVKTFSVLGHVDREIIAFRFIAELSLEEISETLSLSLSATKMRLYRAVERFNSAARKNQEGEG